MARDYKSTWRLKLILLALLVAGTASFLVNTRTPSFISVTSDSDLVIIPTDTLAREQVRFYSNRGRAGEELRFILGRDSRSEIHAAMDECQRCYSYHKGYNWSLGHLVCNFCGNRYKLHRMASGLASCVPVKLQIQVTNQTAKIKSADLERERGLL